MDEEQDAGGRKHAVHMSLLALLATSQLSCVPWDLPWSGKLLSEACLWAGCAGYAALLAACPTFEAFWQGRLIPGACVDSLPFIRSVQARRNAAAKDKLPDEVFSRLRYYHESCSESCSAGSGTTMSHALSHVQPAQVLP
jgi:hypothetical protein